MSNSPRWPAWPSRTSCRPRSAARWPSPSSAAWSAAQSTTHRQLLGRPDPHRDSGSCCRWRSWLALVFVSQGVIENFHGATHGDHASPGPDSGHPGGPGGQPGGDQGGRHRTAAASSTPTRPTPSRTPTDHQPPAAVAASSPSRSPSPSPSARWPGTRSRAGSSSPPCSCCGSSHALIAMRFETARQPQADRGRGQPGRRPRPSRAATWRARRPASARRLRPLRRRPRRAPPTARSTAPHDSLTPLGGGRAARQHDVRRGQPGRHRRRASTAC